MKSFYVYIMASKRNGTLYVGSTVDLIKRVWEHKNNVAPGFTATYDLHMLVFYEVHQSYVEAARREKRFKNWSCQWKINIIEQVNSEWRDLS
ncbi:TPA: GIY-YIG nuclease family protein [Legionella pneumophila]|uniref:GIY-YIG nuclease family protein n=1 Tax=Legionella pneumophila TaxID=446 RepID=UPI001A1C7C13|nr:GIY-YIG nuclease family protein [Legionella pneumophila]HAT8309925.1 GIY-YIG nuclease family protein [Legionella pneumophila]HAU0215838.1 GIY-YIG nuclease family protein [Legionella pneumophila]HAU1061929.1 GIY-YIG nuclease family protein [Legionella pneumophila]HAU1204286.1 GIY-YIG nuclease family protein [Legionella pneumophila]